MKIYEYKLGEGLDIGRCVVALGFFDGVHLAHRELIKAAKEKANSLGALCAVFTFPSECGLLKNASPRIYGTAEKLKIFEELGIDACIIADFMSISGLSAEDFIKNVIIRDMGAVSAVCGYNFRFGKGASGNTELLSKVMSLAGLEAFILDEYTYKGNVISSSTIREYISAGDVKTANELLGGELFFTGAVMHGRGDGRGFGFPTVNTALPEYRQLPRLGVYKTRIPIDGIDYIGLTNIGVCPSFGERQVHLETYILGFKGDLYGRELDIYLQDFIRDEKHFSSKEELIMQINIDKNKVLKESI